MIDFWVFAAAVIIMAIVAYYLGYRACDDKWQNGVQEEVMKMVNQKVNDVGALYNETYKNVLRELLTIAEEVEEERNKNGQK